MEKGFIRREQLAFERDFTQIPNAWLRDERLSLRARGILALLMSHREGWGLALVDMITRDEDGKAKEGRKSIQIAVAELTDLGYLVRGKRGRDEKGHLKGADWLLQDPENRLSDPE